MRATDRWSTPRLAEFVVAVTGAADEASAIRRAVDWATEALEAEVGVVLEGGVALASVGFARGDVPIATLTPVIAAGGGIVELEGVGVCCLAATRLSSESAVDLVVARAGTDGFDREETALLHAAARSLTMTLRLFRALAAERSMSERLHRRQALLERLSLIQRGIARRVPLADMLRTITTSARDLLGVELATLRLIDPSSPREMVLASQAGLPDDVAASIDRTLVGDGVSGRAAAEERLVVGDASDVLWARPSLAGQNVVRAMAAPVRDGERVTGSILVASTRHDHQFDSSEQEALVAFAEHAGLALTDAKRVEHIQRLAFHDELTGLPNRGLFMERLEQSLLRSRRRHGELAVLFLDIDRFKDINDSLGHTAGDRLLITVGERLRHCLRDEDTAARLGGDEFAILAHCDHDGAVEIAARVLHAMQPAFTIEDREVTAAASIGIALDRDGHSDAGGMLRDADTAMYRAKAAGNGFVVFEPSMHAAALARMDLEADLRRALLCDEMRLDYQPIVNVATGRIVGLEALIRWHHPRHGVVSPLDFIPLAEETGQIAELGRWILQQACRNGRDWRVRGGTDANLTMSINVSPRQLQDARFVQDVADALDISGLDPSGLVLEITEGAVMVDVETAIQRLLELRQLGVSLAVDDFGTGHSSLALLRRLPVDIIKIDKMFVDAIATDDVAASFLQTIIQMAEILSLSVVVEGIETAEQAARVSGFGGVLAQGYRFSRPMPAAGIDRLLATQAGSATSSIAV